MMNVRGSRCAYACFMRVSFPHTRVCSHALRTFMILTLASANAVTLLELQQRCRATRTTFFRIKNIRCSRRRNCNNALVVRCTWTATALIVINRVDNGDRFHRRNSTGRGTIKLQKRLKSINIKLIKEIILLCKINYN